MLAANRLPGNLSPSPPRIGYQRDISGTAGPRAGTISRTHRATFLALPYIRARLDWVASADAKV